MQNHQSAWPQLAFSLCALSLPLSFQLATAAPTSLPEGIWCMLVLSIWASLVGGLLVAGSLIAMLIRLLHGCREKVAMRAEGARLRECRSPSCARLRSDHSFGVCEARSASRSRIRSS